MIKNNQKKLNILHVLMDALIIVASYWIAWAIKFGSIFREGAFE